MQVPLFDCRVDETGLAAIAPVLQSGQLAGGPQLVGLEEDLSVQFGGRPVVALSDMTQALAIALRLSGVGPGDEVLTLSFNCLSSNAAVHAVGAHAVWVDIDPMTASMNIEHAKSLVTSKTRALVAYHVIGYPSDSAALRALCDTAGLSFIEDANNALGARLPTGQLAGTIGDFAILSFYANRQVSGCEGAALICASEEAASVARRWRRFGVDQARFRDAEGEIDPAADVPDLGFGFSASLTQVNAALARSNLARLVDRQRVVQDNAAFLISAFSDAIGVEPVRALGAGVSAYWGLLLLSPHRDIVLSQLKSAGIGCSKLHYPNHFYSAFEGPEPVLPGTICMMKQALAVPCGWWIGDKERRAIVDTVLAAVSEL